MSQSKKILESWEANAANWITTIDQHEIESRNLVTNNAIIDAIRGYSPSYILDIGCGEGWLTRALQQKGMDAFGIDAVPLLVQNAIKKGGGRYAVCTYRQLADGAVLPKIPFDAAACNFSLIDKEETELVLAYLPKLMVKGGLVFIQTLHPYTASGDLYESGWREGSWNGMKQDFVLPYQWYFRTLESWVQLFRTSGYLLEEIKECVHPATKKPLSIIFVLRCIST